MSSPLSPISYHFPSAKPGQSSPPGSPPRRRLPVVPRERSSLRPLPTLPQPVMSQPLRCKQCRTIITSANLLLPQSKIPSDARAFRGFAGKASLFTEVTHVIEAKPGVQLMASGAHRMSELTCARCQAYIGWHILRAHDRSEKWKEGTYLLELECLSSADSSPLSNTGPWHSTDYSDDSS